LETTLTLLPALPALSAIAGRTVFQLSDTLADDLVDPAGELG
jgi:hypothetical protein